jgi:rhodanese-related sulfurtransferase
VADRLEEFEGKTAIVVFCRSGSRSGMAKAILAQAGISNVTNGGTWQDVKKYIN